MFSDGIAMLLNLRKNPAKFWFWFWPALGILALGFMITVAVREPSANRTWVKEHVKSPIVRVIGHQVFVDNVRDFIYSPKGQSTPHYISRQFDLDKLRTAYFVLTPFSKQWRGPAHSFVTFGFAGSEYISISVEARREQGETYGAWPGLQRKFELLYVIGTEPDLIGSRAVFGSYPIYLYPVNTTPAKVRAMFLAMVTRAEHLRTHPEFYNTFDNNCTSNIIDHVNAISPHKVPAGWKTILPGYTDEVAFSLGLIPKDGDIETLRHRYQINASAKAAFGQPDFSKRIRHLP